ncbi:MAG: hypothetical protein V2I65_13975 [Paracoccaceae bacterium]|jgi:hypothetical protein|nr:hypothetical protein [Paracoccaceae bacterium]
MPDFDDEMEQAQAGGFDWPQIDRATTLLGTSMLALELSLADDRFADTASGMAWDIIIEIIGVVAGVPGCTSSLGAMIAGLAPVTVDYRSRVRPHLPRKLALPRSTPPDAAAEEYCRRHLQDLFVVQTLRG